MDSEFRSPPTREKFKICFYLMSATCTRGIYRENHFSHKALSKASPLTKLL